MNTVNELIAYGQDVLDETNYLRTHLPYISVVPLERMQTPLHNILEKLKSETLPPLSEEDCWVYNEALGFFRSVLDEAYAFTQAPRYERLQTAS